ncbi:MAG: ATP-binding protein [Chloroflexota bacterium]
MVSTSGQLHHLFQTVRGWLASYIVALCAVIATVLIKQIINPYIEIPNPLLLFFAPIVISAWHGGIGPGLFATVLSVLASDYLFIPPTFSFFNYQDGFGIWLVLFAFEGVLISLFSATSRRNQRKLSVREQQQASVAKLGQRALASTPTSLLMEQAVALIARDLNVTHCQILALQPDKQELLLQTGVGWRSELIGKTRIPVNTASQAGYTLEAKEPVIVTDLRTETRFPGIPLFHDQGIVSGINVIIEGRENPFGILSTHTTRRRKFTEDDISFLHAVANVLATAIERERAEEEMRSSEERLKTILQQMPSGVMIADARSGRLILTNEKVEQIMRRPIQTTNSFDQHDQYVGFHTDRQPYRPEDWPLMRTIRSGEVIVDEEIDIQRGDDTSGTILVSASPIKNHLGQVVAGVVTFLDITERKRAETMQRFLGEASTRLSSSLDYATTMQTLAHVAIPTLADVCTIHALTEDGVIRQLAAAHTDITKEHILWDIERHFPVDPENTYGIMRVIQTGQVELLYEPPMPRWKQHIPSTEHHGMLTQLDIQSHLCFPLTARGNILGAISFMLTQSDRHYTANDIPLIEEFVRRAATAADNARLYLEAQEAVRTRDQFLSIASHELKTPLTSLRGYAELFQRRATREGTLKERDQRALTIILEQSSRLNRLIDSLLDLSRIQMGRLGIDQAPIDMRELTQRVVERTRMSVDQHTLDLHNVEQPLMVQGDELRLEQVLQNLIQNAIKYSPEHNMISIRVERHEHTAHISVIDQGIGIPTEALPRLFRRFYRAQNVDPKRISGMGIGLFLVKEFVTLHGGEVIVESQEGIGSTFTVSLPLVTSQHNDHSREETVAA